MDYSTLNNVWNLLKAGLAVFREERPRRMDNLALAEGEGSLLLGGGHRLWMLLRERWGSRRADQGFAAAHLSEPQFQGLSLCFLVLS